MGLNLLLSTNHIVIHSYSPVADFLLVVMCLLALLLIRQTFIKQSRTFRIFKACFALLFIAAVSNIAFYYADLFSRQNTLLWILRAVYHISLLSLFCLYIAYLKILIVFPKNILSVLRHPCGDRSCRSGISSDRLGISSGSLRNLV